MRDDNIPNRLTAVSGEDSLARGNMRLLLPGVFLLSSRKAQGTILKFTIIDSNGGQSLPVVFQGVAPDTFKVDADVVVEDYLAPEGIFQASTILALCSLRFSDLVN